MNLKTTLALLVLAGAIFAVYRFTVEDDQVTPGNRLPFGDLALEDVTEILIEDREAKAPASPIRIKRVGQEWQMTSAGLPGETMRARHEVIETMVSLLRELPFDVKVKELSAGQGEIDNGFGELTKKILTLRRGGGDSVVLEFGALDDSGSILVRQGGTMTAYAVDQSVRDELLRDLSALRDLRLLAKSALSVKSIIVKDRSGVRFQLAREFAGWFLSQPFTAPADPQRAEEFRNNLLALQVLGSVVPVGPDAGSEEVLHEVEIAFEGEPEPTRLLFYESLPNGTPVHVEGEKVRRLVTRAIVPHLERAAGWFRDRTLFPFPAVEVDRIAVKRGGTRHLELLRPMKGAPLRLRRGDTGTEADLLELDAVAGPQFVDRLVNLRIFRSENRRVEFEENLTLEVVRRPGGGDRTTTQSLVIGAPDPQGDVPIRIQGESGTSWITEKDLAFLETPLVALRTRVLHQGAYWELARVRVRGVDGASCALKGRLGDDRNLELAMMRDGSRELVPRELQSPVTDRILFLNAAAFIGDAAADQLGFESPTAVIEWDIAPEATSTSLPEEPKKLVSHTWTIGLRRDNGRFACRYSGEPGLLFEIEEKDLHPFLRLLAWSKR